MSGYRTYRSSHGSAGQRYTAGGDVLRLLKSAAAATHAQEQESQQQLRGLQTDAERDVQARGEQLQRLAEHYLPAMTHEAISKTFVEIRSELHSILRDKQQHEADLQQRWDTALDNRQRLETELDHVTAELNALVEQRGELEDQLAERLERDDAFQDLSRRALAAEQELERNRDRVRQSRQEADEKLPAYERNRLFKYLIDRQFGTSGYKKRGLTRRLDRWVARLVNFDKAKKSYDFLRVTPELMQAEVDRRQSEFDQLMGEAETIEQQHATQIGLTEVIKQGLKTGRQRDATLTQIETEQREQDALEAEMEQLAGRDNQFYAKAVERLEQFLGGLHESALEAKTQGTAQQTDDAIFVEIRWLNERLAEARSRVNDLRRRHAELHRQRNDLADLARRFQIAEYDSRRSVFPENYDPRPEVERLLKGQIGKETLWSEIKRHQQFLPTWVERQTRDRRDLYDNDFSYVLMRVLAEAAGAAIRHAADSHRRGRRGRSRRRGGFTGGRGF